MFRKRKPGRRPRPAAAVRNHMSRHSPILVSDPKPVPQKVLEPVRPLMLDDVAYDANYDDSAYDDDDYFDIGNIDNNLAKKRGELYISKLNSCWSKTIIFIVLSDIYLSKVKGYFE